MEIEGPCSFEIYFGLEQREKDFGCPCDMAKLFEDSLN